MDQEEFEQYEKAGMAVADVRGAIELARDEGIQEGRQEGIQEGGATLLLLLLEGKFGQISEMVRNRVLSADQVILQKWSLRVLKSGTLDDVFL